MRKRKAENKVRVFRMECEWESIFDIDDALLKSHKHDQKDDGEKVKG